MRALFDTCIIIDVLQNREPFAADGQKLFLAVANKKFTGCITAKSSTNIYYLTHRITHSDKETRNMLSKLFTLFEVLDTSGIDTRKAISSEMTDYEDAVMAETALRSEIDCIITRNQKDYSKSPVKVMSPAEFLSTLDD